MAGANSGSAYPPISRPGEESWQHGFRVVKNSGFKGLELRVFQNQRYLLGILILRITVFWGLYWVPPLSGNYNLGLEA